MEKEKPKKTERYFGLYLKFKGKLSSYYGEMFWSEIFYLAMEAFAGRWAEKNHIQEEEIESEKRKKSEEMKKFIAQLEKRES